MLPAEAEGRVTVASNYQELRKLLARAGFFDKQPLYYGLAMAGTLLGFTFCLWIFTWATRPAAIFLNTCLFGFISVQLGFLMHDAGHGAIFRETWKNDAVGLIAADLLIGLAYGWYTPHHSRHHAHPNHNELDPDLPVLRVALALSEEEARNVRGWKRLVVKHQAYLLPLLFPMETLTLKFLGFKFLLLERPRRRWLELGLVTLHHAAYIGFLVYWLGPWPALGVALMHHMVAGTYLSTVLMTNHLGRPFASKDASDPFVDQVEPSRNVRTHPLFECLWGSLNHQIEHHLFPAMSRNKIRRALPIVRKFCVERGVAYEEVSLFECYRQILRELNHIGASTRGSEAPTSHGSRASTS
jgi:fatty acid desaturase